MRTMKTTRRAALGGMEAAAAKGQVALLRELHAQSTEHRHILYHWTTRRALHRAIEARQIEAVKFFILELGMHLNAESTAKALTSGWDEICELYLTRDPISQEAACRIANKGGNAVPFIQTLSKELFIATRLGPLSPLNDTAVDMMLDKFTTDIASFRYTDQEIALLGTYDTTSIISVLCPLDADPVPKWHCWKYQFDAFDFIPHINDDDFAELCENDDLAGVKFLLDEADYEPDDLGPLQDAILVNKRIARYVVAFLNIDDWKDLC